MIYPDFPASYEQILNRVDDINPAGYASTRNYTHGTVTRLSPYISRGVISTRLVMEQVLEKGFTLPQSIKFLQELAWREYFQRVWQYMGEGILEDIRQRYTGILHTRMQKEFLKRKRVLMPLIKGSTIFTVPVTCTIISECILPALPVISPGLTGNCLHNGCTIIFWMVILPATVAVGNG
jgi:hypothetical protein